VIKQKHQDNFIFQRGKPTTIITREIYSKIMERWDSTDMMEERFPIKIMHDDPTIKEYVEENVHFSWSNVINWFGDEGKRIKKILWEQKII